jgi:hypothetical protein
VTTRRASSRVRPLAVEKSAQFAADVAGVREIDWSRYDEATTHDFKDWEDLRKTLAISTETLRELQDKLAEYLTTTRPSWIQERTADASCTAMSVAKQPAITDDAQDNTVSKRSSLTEQQLAEFKDTKHPAFNADRRAKVRSVHDAP